MSDPKPNTTVDKLLGVLADPAAAEEWLGLAFDLAIDRPLNAFADPSAALETLALALSKPVTTRAVREHALGFPERELERARARGDRLEAWLSPDSRNEVRRLIGRPIALSRPFLEWLVQQEVVRGTLRALVKETLDRFVQTLSPSGSGGGILGSLGRGAVGLGRGLLGGLGRQLEAQLKRAATLFVDSSMTILSARLVDYLSRPETAEQLGRSAQSLFDEAMTLKTAQIVEAVQKAPLQEILEIAPDVLAHNLARSDVRAAVRAEMDAALEIEGDRTIREILEDAGAIDHARAEVLRIALPLVTALADDEGTRAWLSAHL